MNPLLISLLIVLAAGCSRRPIVAGGLGGGTSVYADGPKGIAVVKQLDPQLNVLFLIAWTFDRDGATNSLSDQGLLATVRDPRVQPSSQKRAVYTLQPDYTLSEVPLTQEQISALFGETQGSDFQPSQSELWQKAVAPLLRSVKVKNGR